MSLPYFAPPDLSIRVPIHLFGVIVVTGITVGAAVMQRYVRRVGESAADARSVIAWVAACGLIGAHVLDCVFYRPGEVLHHPWILLEVWTSISSYGGFIGGALGFAYIVRRRRLRLARWADITMVGLLVAFTFGRAGCATVHDHIGARTTAAIGVDFPRAVLAEHRVLTELHATPAAGTDVVRAHDLGLEELLYLIPVNALILGLAFRRRRPLPAGALAVLAAALYAPVRFGLENWRLASSDPLYAGLTFAQWGSLAVLAIALVLGTRLVLGRRATG